MSASPPQHPVFLTGMMGSGKSTLAPLLAAAWSAKWVDLDRRIERIFGATVAELFVEGEANFRRCEAAALRSLLAEPGVRARTLVVATGGGAPLDPSLRSLMFEVGTIIHLRVGVDELVARLCGGDGTRPLLAGDPQQLRGRLTALLMARRQVYACADLVVDGSGPPQDVLSRVVTATFGGKAQDDE